jgi:hypothetical protein
MKAFVKVSGVLAAPTRRKLGLATSDKIRDKIWMARMLTGEEEALAKGIESATAAERDRFSYLRLRKHLDFTPSDLDGNDALFAGISNDVSASADRGRAMRRAAAVSFPAGRAYYSGCRGFRNDANGGGE